MARRSRIEVSDYQRELLLHRIRAWRQDCQGVLARVPVTGEVYKAVSGITDAIDGLAEVLTGDRTHLWNKPHSVGDGPKAAAPGTVAPPARKAR